MVFMTQSIHAGVYWCQACGCPVTVAF